MTPEELESIGTTSAPRPAARTAGEAGELQRALVRARAALCADQRPDGHWCYELEADATIPAEYILMMHFQDELDTALQEKLAVYLRREQADHGGWPLYWGGDLDVSASVKAYWALKLAGDDPESEPMRRAREAILAHGGAARANVFTRIALALFGHVPWRAVPVVPVELVLLPRAAPFHLGRVSYWTRTVVVPLAVLCSLKARAKNPTGLGIAELFRVPPDEERDWFPVRSPLNRIFLALERALRPFVERSPGPLRRRALARAQAWFEERLNGTDGLGAIFPAMVNAYEALTVLGVEPDDPRRVRAREALRRLVIEHDTWAYCQPCVSPVWDTALAGLALAEVRRVEREAEAQAGLDEALDRAGRWLVERQVLDGPADWRAARPDLAPGGWAFQYANPHYPDLDDTAAVVWALEAFDPGAWGETEARAADWVRGMQSRNGGYGAFDADNDAAFLNEIPFADHGALLDPPTADVSARCLLMFARLDRPEDRAVRERILTCLLDEQEDQGSWFGRWGSNHVYGTWSVLAAFEHLSDAEQTRARAAIDRAVDWLVSVQRPDGSWGESNDSYADPGLAGRGGAGTPFQTAWALLGLLAAGRGDLEAVRRGVGFLLATQDPDGLWSAREFTAPGFPRVFYLRYHGYAKVFPTWALARFRRHVLEAERAR